MNDPSLAFPKTLRLLQSAQFSRVFEHPKAIRRSAWTILCSPNGLTYPRLGLIVSKKNAPTAVQRNLIKRMARETFRQEHYHLPCWDLVILPKHKITSMSNHSAMLQLKKALCSLNTLEEE